MKRSVPIPFIDLNTQYQKNKASLDKAILNVLDHGQYIMGPEVVALEKQLADYVEVSYCVTCSSGTDALLIPLMAHDIGPGDAVFTTPFTFVATTEVISLLGATPVFVDVDENTFNINPNILEAVILQTINETDLNPKAIIPVDLFGLPADYDAINKIAKKYNLWVLEDAAQGFGAEYKGRKTGGLTDCGATSFFPAKPLGCYGDGGAIFTNDQAFYEKLISIRVHGQGKTKDKYDNVRIGLTARMDSIQAAILLEKLKIYNDELVARNRVADIYSKGLNSCLKTPTIPAGYSSVWAQYTVVAGNGEHRQIIRDQLNKNGIPSAIYYPIPLHLAKAYRNLGYKNGDFPVSESLSNTVFSLPMHPYIDLETQEKIISIIVDTYNNVLVLSN